MNCSNTNHSKKTIVWLNGPPRCGKDTAAAYICSTIGLDVCAHVKLADPINDALRGLFKHLLDKDWDELREEKKNVISELLLNKSLRESFISFSEDWAKPFFGKDIFGVLLAKRIETLIKNKPKTKIIVVSDSGFREEIQHVVTRFPELNNILVRIKREGCDFKNDSRSYLSNICQLEIDIQNESIAKFIEELNIKVLSHLKQMRLKQNEQVSKVWNFYRKTE